MPPADWSCVSTFNESPCTFWEPQQKRFNIASNMPSILKKPYFLCIWLSSFFFTKHLQLLLCVPFGLLGVCFLDLLGGFLGCCRDTRLQCYPFLMKQESSTWWERAWTCRDASTIALVAITAAWLLHQGPRITAANSDGSLSITSTSFSKQYGLLRFSHQNAKLVRLHPYLCVRSMCHDKLERKTANDHFTAGFICRSAFMR